MIQNLIFTRDSLLKLLTLDLAELIKLFVSSFTLFFTSFILSLICLFISSTDKFIYKSPLIKNTMVLGGCMSGSNYVASTIQELGMIPTISIAETYNSENINIKTIEQRLIELSLSIGT